MEIIQKKKIEFCQDGRGWSIKPIPEEEMVNGKISNIHLASMKPGAVRGNHYHLHMTEHMLVIGGVCKVTVQDRKTKQKEEVIIENNVETLILFPPLLTHAIENIGSEISYLFCYSRIHEDLQKHEAVMEKIV